MKTEISNLTTKDFSKLLGIEETELPEICHKLIKTRDFRYQRIEPKEQNELIQKINKDIENNVYFSAGKKALSVWKKRWSDILEKLVSENLNVEVLNPKYFNQKSIKNYYCRLGCEIIKPLDIDFELAWSHVFKYWLFGKYFAEFDHIYEFGSGSGMNIPILTDLFPEKEMCFLDWVPSSNAITNFLSQKYGWKISGHVFDMFNPDYNLEIKKNSAFLLFSALEQLGTDYKAFIEFALKKKVSLFLTVDSIEELYDKSNPVDNLAIKFDKKRNYLRGYLTYLRKLESKKKIKILKIHRTLLGGLNHEGYSFVVWKPI